MEDEEYKQKLLKELLEAVNDLNKLIDTKRHPGKSKAIKKANQRVSRCLGRYQQPLSAWLQDFTIRFITRPMPLPSEVSNVYEGLSRFINVGNEVEHG